MLVRHFPFVPSDPLSAWIDLHRRPRHGFFLGSGAASEKDHLLFFSASEPSRLLTVEEIRLVPKKMGRAFNLPRYVGYLGFEAGRTFDEGLKRLPKRPNPLRTPTTLFGDYPSVVRVDLKKRETTVLAPNNKELKRIVTVLGRHGSHSGSPHPSAGRGSRFKYLSGAEFSKRVLKAKQAIARGDIYQANLSIRFERDFRGSPVDLYRLLCQKNPSPYAALLKVGPRWIVSSSPELLLSVEGNILRTRPIAGTRPRGDTAGKDRKLKGQLLLSPKERAEHIMLVDLERNDLGRVSVPGSVKVTERFAVENYSHVMHIVSEVRGKLQHGKSSLEALCAVFPGGTITGCPKIASIKIIEELEAQARGPFYGSAGYFAWNRDAHFNILIRTALIQRNKIYVQAGAGIVADSRPAQEYRESWAKAQVLLEAVHQIE